MHTKTHRSHPPASAPHCLLYVASRSQLAHFLPAAQSGAQSAQPGAFGLASQIARTCMRHAAQQRRGGWVVTSDTTLLMRLGRPRRQVPRCSCLIARKRERGGNGVRGGERECSWAATTCLQQQYGLKQDGTYLRIQCCCGWDGFESSQLALGNRRALHTHALQVFTACMPKKHTQPQHKGRSGGSQRTAPPQRKGSEVPLTSQPSSCTRGWVRADLVCVLLGAGRQAAHTHTWGSVCVPPAMRDMPVSSLQMVATWLKTLQASALLLETLAAPGPDGEPDTPAPALSQAFCTLQPACHVHVVVHMHGAEVVSPRLL